MFLEDMDTSESEHSDRDSADDEWVCPNRRVKKRISKNGNRAGSGQFGDDSGNLSLDSSGEGITGGKQNAKSGLCCTCSKSSLCKTNKCQCRAAGGACKASCGCSSTKCSNREAIIIKEDELSKPNMASEQSGQGADETDKDHALVTHGAMLLQNALIERPADTDEDGGARRKPLSDIGNTLVCKIPTS